MKKPWFKRGPMKNMNYFSCRQYKNIPIKKAHGKHKQLSKKMRCMQRMHTCNTGELYPGLKAVGSLLKDTGCEI